MSSLVNLGPQLPRIAEQVKRKDPEIGASLRAHSFPVEGTVRAELLKCADMVLHVAKASGRGVLRLFEPEMRANAQRRLSMLRLARNVLKQDLLVAHYQPKVDLEAGSLDGFEALLRWEHPRSGWQAPDTIAVAFKDRVLATEISDRMIHSVIHDMRCWADAGIAFGHVAINAAAVELSSKAFAQSLLTRLRLANLPTSCLQMEVTENVFLGAEAVQVEDTLSALAQEGIQIAFDDFGTGYASLCHLNKFPVSVIKIDRSFISNLETSAHDATIVQAIIKLGRSLGIRVVAEGIETENQASFLTRHHCQAGQGHLFGTAVPASVVPSLVKSWSGAFNTTSPDQERTDISDPPAL